MDNALTGVFAVALGLVALARTPRALTAAGTARWERAGAALLFLSVSIFALSLGVGIFAQQAKASALLAACVVAANIAGIALLGLVPLWLIVYALRGLLRRQRARTVE